MLESVVQTKYKKKKRKKNRFFAFVILDFLSFRLLADNKPLNGFAECGFLIRFHVSFTSSSVVIVQERMK